jgi:hypothetical protein
VATGLQPVRAGRTFGKELFWQAERTALLTEAFEILIHLYRVP